MLRAVLEDEHEHEDGTVWYISRMLSRAGQGCWRVVTGEVDRFTRDGLDCSTKRWMQGTYCGVGCIRGVVMTA